MRFYDPQQGTIPLDGIGITQADISRLLSSIGIVPQGAVIFAANVMENIRLVKVDACAAESKLAPQATAADKFIQRLPDDYNTFLGERGIRLSGEQLQRIAIARAILKNPPVLLLDEATSALDAESEKLAQEAMAQLMKNRTTLIIAHRLATVFKADCIIVVEQGQIVAIGKHQELLKQGGICSRLAALQFAETHSFTDDRGKYSIHL